MKLISCNFYSKKFLTFLVVHHARMERIVMKIHTTPAVTNVLTIWHVWVGIFTSLSKGIGEAQKLLITASNVLTMNLACIWKEVYFFEIIFLGEDYKIQKEIWVWQVFVRQDIMELHVQVVILDTLNLEVKFFLLKNLIHFRLSKSKMCKLFKECRILHQISSLSCYPNPHHYLCYQVIFLLENFLYHSQGHVLRNPIQMLKI